MSIQKIAVGVDLSPSSELAVAQAMGLARRCGAQVVLVHIGGLADERARVEDVRQRLIGQGVEVSHVFADGAGDHALAEVAHELGADLLAIGTQGRTGLGRLLLGSVAERTVRVASSSVLVARGEPQAAAGGYRRIVVGTDYSPLADRAIERALELAADGAQLHVVHAWHVPAPIAPESAVAIADLRGALAEESQRQGAELLRKWRGARPGVAFEMETDEAPAQQALTERALALGADLIAVGSHGRRGVRRWLLGSVAETTVRHAPCSVLVAR